ncbi:hypothetical protein L7F22_057989 [Adiantum nelumboides]|nr:hypothetical protein [Adiantum nelumboides]
MAASLLVPVCLLQPIATVKPFLLRRSGLLLVQREQKKVPITQKEKVGKVTVDQVRAMATSRLNCSTIESAMRIIVGTAANMGIDIDPPLLK